MKALIISLILLFPSIILAQPYLFKEYNIGVPANNRGWALQSDEEGYTIATGSRCDGDHSCFGLIRLDLEGNEIWKRVIDVVPNNFRQGARNSILKDHEGNIVVAGDQYTGSNFRIFMMKFSSDGDSLWTQFYESPSSRYARSLSLLENGDLLIHGDGDTTGMLHPNKTIIKTNSDGEVIWHKDYIDDFRASQQGNMEVLKTGELLMGYKTWTWTSIDPWMTLTKLSSDGNIIWTNRYYKDEWDLSLLRVRELTNGNYMFISSKDSTDFSTGKGPVAIPVMVTDTAGNVLYENLIYNGNTATYIDDFKEDTDGNLIGIGAIYSEEVGDWIPWLYKLSPEGELIWQRFISNEGHFFNQLFKFEALQLNPYGDIAISMSTAGAEPNTPFNKDVGFLILNSDGCLYPNCDTSVQYITTLVNEINVNNDFALKAFPNPVNDILHLSWTIPVKGNVQLINAVGILEKNIEVGIEEQSLDVDLSTLANGIYYLQFREQGHLTYQEKIIVIR